MNPKAKTGRSHSAALRKDQPGEEMENKPMKKVIIICLTAIFVLCIPYILIIFCGEFIIGFDDRPYNYLSIFLAYYIYVMPVGVIICVLFPLYYKLHLIEKERKQSET
ncbi:MAG: hypothetical protein IT244_10165 [Bacteroidia bacterium]|nr:hypothetical protein [Bacteroidia bacterium]